MPHIEDQIHTLGGFKYFTSLDLESVFYQVRMAANSIEKKPLVTPY